MLTEADVRRVGRNNLAIGLPAMAIAIAAVFGYIFACGQYLNGAEEYLASHYGYDNAEWIRPAAALGGLPLVLGPLLLGHLITRRFPAWFEVRCPHCNAPLGNMQALLITRTCAACDQHVISDGRARAKELFTRHRRYVGHRVEKVIVQVGYLAFLLIGWIALPSGCIGCGIAGGVKGFLFSYWGWTKTRQWRFIAGMAAGALLILLSFGLFWHYC
jgi:hypothetical protein